MKSFKIWLTRLLKKSEPYTKTDMLYLFKSNFWLNINKLLSIGNGFLLSVAFANLITKEDYGVYTFVLAIIGLFTMAPTTALGNGITRESALGNHQIIFEGKRKILPWSIMTGCILILTGIYYGINDNSILFICFTLAGLALPTMISSSIAKSFLSAVGDFKLLTTFNLYRSPLMTVALLTSLWLSRSVLTVIIVHIIGNLILGMLLYRSVIKNYSLKNNHVDSGKFASQYAFHTSIISIFSYLSEKIDGIILWKLLGAGPLAIYAYAISPVRELKGFFETQSAIALPKFAKRDFQTIKENIYQKIKKLYFIAVPVVVVYIFSAPYLFKIFFPQYTDSILLTQIASLSILASPKRLISVAISAHQKIKESYLMTIIPNIIKITSFIIFIPIYGLIGAVFSLIITETIDYLILVILINKSKA